MTVLVLLDTKVKVLDYVNFAAFNILIWLMSS